MTVHAMLAATAKRSPAAIALTHQGRNHTYAEIAAGSDRTAAALRGSSV